MMDYEEKKYGEYANSYYAANNAGMQQHAAPAAQPAMNNYPGIAKIKVVGVGGAGNNAVDRLIESGLKSAEYIVVNTDSQALLRSKAPRRIQIGAKLTKGLGAGADPSIGKAAAEESKDEIQQSLRDTDLLFITAGMGGGTGTGAAPVIAKIARDMKILTVAVITLPFSFEAKRRMDNAFAGIEELAKYVDAIITIPNDKIQEVVPKGTSFAEALMVADEVLRQGIRGIAELIVKPSLINLDFADVRTTLKGCGLAHMGIGVAKGEKRIPEAVRRAVYSPLLNTTIEGANSVILNVIGGKDLGFEEVREAANLVKGVIDYSANVIFGACIDEHMADEVEIVIIATGFNNISNFGINNGVAEQSAAALTQKIERAYNAGKIGNGGSFNAGYPATGATQENFNNLGNGGFTPIGSYAANQTGANYGAGYPQNGNMQLNPMMPASNGYPQNTSSFEPNDPIPETTETANTEKKHWPRFLDSLMKKNNNENE